MLYVSGSVSLYVDEIVYVMVNGETVEMFDEFDAALEYAETQLPNFFSANLTLVH